MRKLTPEEKTLAKIATTEYKKKWYLANKERLAEASKNYVKNNKEKKRKYDFEYRKNNKAKITKYKIKWAKDNPDKRKKITKKYYDNNKEKVKECSKKIKRNKWATDLLYRLTTTIRNGVNQAFKRQGYNKKSKTANIIGCSFIELKSYLENKFEPWMNWDNRGLYNGQPNYGWDVDHIIPLSSAKTEANLIKLLHYSNLQPLCSYVNRNVKKHRLL